MHTHTHTQDFFKGNFFSFATYLRIEGPEQNPLLIWKAGRTSVAIACARADLPRVSHPRKSRSSHSWPWASSSGLVTRDADERQQPLQLLETETVLDLFIKRGRGSSAGANHLNGPFPSLHPAWAHSSSSGTTSVLKVLPAQPMASNSRVTLSTVWQALLLAASLPIGPVKPTSESPGAQGYKM